MAFLDENYLLVSTAAKELYAAVKELPIIDAHNHCDVKQLCENKPYTDIWEAEGATDHYVWEMLRKRGVEETYITGDASNEEKWLAMSNVFEEIAGNPTYEWVHLDLKRRLGIDDLICSANGKKIWDESKELFAQDVYRPQELVKSMKVEAMCSTDDPVDSLEWHKKLQNSSIAGVVRPTFRPDKAMNIFKEDWVDYVKTLEKRVNGCFKSIKDMIAALQECHDYFAENGCVASDHGVEVPYGFDVEQADADEVFKKAFIEKQELDEEETIAFMSYVLQQVAEMDAEKGWVFQFHIGAVRDIRESLYKNIGPDTGGDISDHCIDIVSPIKDFLNRFDNRLKIVLYNLSPEHHSTMATLSRAFGKNVNLGSAWWLLDTPYGMKTQLEYVATVDLLMNTTGMVSDSRKILSYGSRHEMYRRCLCSVLGKMTELGQIPAKIAEKIAVYLCYKRPKEFFGL